jgi:SEC-C motif
LYVAFLPLWWYSLPTLATAAGVAANWIYHFLDPRVSINPDGRIIRVFVTTSAIDKAQTISSGLRLDTVTYGLPMLAALVIVTRAESIVAKIRTLLVGLGVMVVLTVPVVMAWAKLTSLEVGEKIAPGSGDTSSLFFEAFHGYAFAQPVVAVGVWLALIMFGLFKGMPRQKTPAMAIPRNAACPCGSGRKYKRCCGRVSS